MAAAQAAAMPASTGMGSEPNRRLCGARASESGTAVVTSP
jgi:hypothetical protein